MEAHATRRCRTRSHLWLAGKFRDPVFCHRYPTEPCAAGDPGVGSAWDKVAFALQSGQPTREGVVAASRRVVGSSGLRAWPTRVNRC